VSPGVVFAFAPIDDGTRMFRERALECVFRRWGLSRPGQSRADIRALERPDSHGASHFASIGRSDDIAFTVERTIRQAEHAADGPEQHLARSIVARLIAARFSRTDRCAVERADQRTGAHDQYGGEPARDQSRYLRRHDLLELQHAARPRDVRQRHRATGQSRRRRRDDPL